MDTINEKRYWQSRLSGEGGRGSSGGGGGGEFRWRHFECEMDLKHNNISYPQLESVSRGSVAKEESDDGWMVAVPRTGEPRDNGCDGDDVDDDGD